MSATCRQQGSCFSHSNSSVDRFDVPGKIEISIVNTKLSFLISTRHVRQVLIK